MNTPSKERRIKKAKAKKAGLPPGSLVYTGEHEDNASDPVKITVFDYTNEHLAEREIKSLEECYEFSESSTVSWINLDGVHNISQIQKIGDHFHIHPLSLEDIVHTNQRPKVDEHDNYIFIVLKMLEFDSKRNCILSEQVSFVVTKNCVISFQENPGDVFDPVRERIRSSKGRIRKCGPDYLAYALIDAIVDHYFIVLEHIGEKIQNLEDLVMENPSQAVTKMVHELKRDAILIRKAVWPAREVVSSLERLESPLMSDFVDPFLRDLYDHTVQVIDSVESYRDILSGLLEIYLTTVSNKMNEIMKVLTIISTIFIPLTFIAGVYGMNFKHMPELEWYYGYPFAMGIMAFIAIGLLILFKVKKWI
jgi:magnesium transporter